MIVSLGALVLAATGAFDPPQQFDAVNGHCAANSHIARGPVDADLTKLEKPYRCDIALIAQYDNHTRVLIQFGDRHGAANSILGFAGVVLPDGEMVKVQRVYLVPKVATEPEDGWCRLFFKGKKMTGITCGARIVQHGRATVPVVAFDMPPQ